MFQEFVEDERVRVSADGVDLVNLIDAEFYSCTLEERARSTSASPREKLESVDERRDDPTR